MPCDACDGGEGLWLAGHDRTVEILLFGGWIFIIIFNYDDDGDADADGLSHRCPFVERWGCTCGLVGIPLWELNQFTS